MGVGKGQRQKSSLNFSHSCYCIKDMCSTEAPLEAQTVTINYCDPSCCDGVSHDPLYSYAFSVMQLEEAHSRLHSTSKQNKIENAHISKQTELTSLS